MRRALLAAVCAAFVLALPGWAAAEGRVGLLEDLTVEGPVTGDVVTVGGDIILGPGARVDGHVIAIFGEVHSDPSAEVQGQVVAVASLAGLSLQPVGGTAWRAALGLRVLAFGLWLLAVNIVLVLIPAVGQASAHDAATLSPGAFALGLLVALTIFAALVGALGLGPLAPHAVVAIVILALLLKTVGLAALTSRLGTCCIPPAASLPLSVRASIALLVLLVLRLIPGVGGLIWTLASIIALGSGTLVAAQRHCVVGRSGAPSGTGSQH